MSPLQMDKAAREFLERGLVLRGRSADTRKGYGHDLRDYLLFMVGREGRALPVKDVTRRQLEAYILSLVERGLAAKTIRRKASALSSFFKWAVYQGLCSTDPTDMLPLPRVKHRVMYCPSQAEVMNFVDSCRCPLTRTIASILFFTGIRVGELCALELDDLHLDSEYLVVKDSKNGRSRVVPLCKAAIQAVTDYIESIRPTTDSPRLLATARTGRVSRNHAIALVRAERKRQQLKHPLTPHALRHAYATALYHKGVDLLKLQHLLGHASLATLQHYTHVRTRQLHEAVSLLD